MFRKIRHKIVRSISQIEPVINENILFVFSSVNSSIIPNQFNNPQIGTIVHNFSSSKISNDVLLSLINTENDYYLLITKDNKGICFLTRYYDDSEKKYTYKYPSSSELFKRLTSIVIDDLLLSKPISVEIEISFNQSIPEIDFDLGLYPALIKELDVNIFLDNVTQIFDIDFAFSIDISRNIFTPMGDAKQGGKNYWKKNEQKDLFGDRDLTDKEIEKGPRKAYKVINKTSRSTHTKLQDPWDLLYPLLLPPIDFDFSEQIDFYLPLYPFQQQGVEFLFNNNSALLADEMGTGKTVQTIIALRFLYRQAIVKKTLIICPKSVLGSAQLSLKTGKSEGWDGHLFNWFPELSVTIVDGNVEQRRLDWHYPAHVYISTYDSIRNDLENGILNLNENIFDCVVVDEAQNIKNRESGRSRAVKKINTKFRWALTGTPIENKIEDVISIFDFIKPKLFKNENYTPQRVKKLIEPYFLRRLKKDVLKDLPEKIRQEEWLDLDTDQQIAYDHILNQGRNQIASSLESENEFTIRRHIFALLTELKNICNFAPDKETSPKTEALLEYINVIVENDEKVLVFSQYDKYGIEILEKFFIKNKIKYVSFRGNMSTSERNRAIADFRNLSLGIPVFLATVKTAGVGISLTEASYVIHFDHWWNPAVMWQAEDRAHRPGQKNKLNVYSFWMSNTIEERIKEKLYQKGLLIESVIDSLATEVIEELISTSEWLEMLGISNNRKRFEKEAEKTVENILEKIKSMSPREFEIITQEFFIKLGYTNSRVTQISRDGGIDVYGTRIINDNEETIIAQCKRTETVSVNIARELLGVMSTNQRIIKGFIVTSGKFSEDCKSFAYSNPRINLIDGISFAKYLKDLKVM